MISRRGALGVGAAMVTVVAGAHLLDVDDDAVRALGVEPRSEPDPADTALLRSARQTQTRIVAAVQAFAGSDDARRPLLALAREQLTVLGGSSEVSDDSPDEAVRLLARGADQAREQSVQAVSPVLARTLASLSAGRSELAVAIGRDA